MPVGGMRGSEVIGEESASRDLDVERLGGGATQGGRLEHPMLAGQYALHCRTLYQTLRELFVTVDSDTGDMYWFDDVHTGVVLNDDFRTTPDRSFERLPS